MMRSTPSSLHRPEVGPVRHQVRRVLVVMTMAGDEGDLHPVNLADGRRCRGWPIGGIHIDGARLVEELVEAGPAKDADHSSLLSDEPEDDDRGRSGFCGGFGGLAVALFLLLALLVLLSLAGLTDDDLERESVE